MLLIHTQNIDSHIGLVQQRGSVFQNPLAVELKTLFRIRIKNSFIAK